MTEWTCGWVRIAYDGMSSAVPAEIYGAFAMHGMAIADDPNGAVVLSGHLDAWVPPLPLVITHIPTGAKLVSRLGRAAAIALMEELDKIDLWDLTLENAFNHPHVAKARALVLRYLEDDE